MLDFELRTIMPEIVILTTACLVLMVDVFMRVRQHNLPYRLTQIGLLFAAVLTFKSFGLGTEIILSGAFISDDLSHLLKLFIYLTTFVVLIYSHAYIRVRQILWGEYYCLTLFAVLGMMLLVSAQNILTLYLGLELLSLSLYAMVAMRRDSQMASEAAMKYFVMGALASGMLLYGFSLLYGITGTLDISTMAQVIASTPITDQLVLIFGLVFVVVGLAFKLGAAPFHMWIPDVYQGAPTSVVAFLSTAPKVAAFGMAIRLLVQALPALHPQWIDLLIVLAVLSIAIGNVVAIAQANIKRMLAYSTISHVGFLLLGLLAGNAAGYSAALFYVLTYSIMSLGAFGMVILLSKQGFEAENIDDFKGLNARSPWLAFIMLLLMFSLAGVPPTVGFYAKLAVIEAVLAVDHLVLALIAVFFAIIGAFYYLRVVKVMYFEAPEDASPITVSGGSRFAISLNGLAVLVLGIFPGALLAVCLAVLA